MRCHNRYFRRITGLRRTQLSICS